MDKIKEKIKQMLKDEFKIIDVDDNQRLFHHLDSINYFRYIIMIEKEFEINVEKDIILKTIKETVDYIISKKQ
jgi:acyl carrier protein